MIINEVSSAFVPGLGHSGVFVAASVTSLFRRCSRRKLDTVKRHLTTNKRRHTQSMASHAEHGVTRLSVVKHTSVYHPWCPSTSTAHRSTTRGALPPAQHVSPPCVVPSHQQHSGTIYPATLLDTVLTHCGLTLLLARDKSGSGYTPVLRQLGAKV